MPRTSFVTLAPKCAAKQDPAGVKLRSVLSDLRRQVQRERQSRAESQVANLRLKELEEELANVKEKLETALAEKYEMKEELEAVQEELEAIHTQGQIGLRRRQRAFPWLHPPNPDPQPPAPVFTKPLPSGLWRHIAGFAPDEVQWKFRRVNSDFYAAFFDRKVVRNPKRKPYNALKALKLAEQGRVFRNIEHLDLTESCFRGKPRRWAKARFTFNPAGFPKLCSLSDPGLWSGDEPDSESIGLYFRILPPFIGHQKITKLEIHGCDLRDLTKFPRVETIIMWEMSEGWNFPGAHPGLREIQFYVPPEITEIAWFVRELIRLCNARTKYPNLERIELLEEKSGARTSFAATKHLMQKADDFGVTICFSCDEAKKVVLQRMDLKNFGSVV